MDARSKGLLLTATGVLLLSPDALVQRWLNLEAMALLAWRGLLMGAGLALLLVWRYRGGFLAQLRACGSTGLWCGLCYASSTLCFLAAMQKVGAAVTLLLFSVSSAFAALLAWCCLGERLPRQTLLSIGVCMVGVLLIVGDDLQGASLAGCLLALLAALLLAGNLTLARSRPAVDMSPGLMLGAFMAAAFSWGGGEPASLDGQQWLVLLVMAGLLLPLGFMLVQLGPQSISPAEVGLLILLEAVLGPLWVWWLLDEAPSTGVLLGGAIVLGGLALNVWLPQRVKSPVLAAQE
ncbi:DMT family transporter [Pseudomonas oryzae]|uniref:EamA-like transporter family protein n=1 Tax=Pseudomonas oryzae TaxID=1392877 RepID=A0A1H1MCQ6_9PSED|nr:DMT family transporter [Pseudomonas oryzae]SDR84621.1 EamA-like transporter family protein [Pseudomonas oryzae]